MKSFVLILIAFTGRIVPPYFSAAFEMAECVTQFCVIIPHTSNSVTPGLLSVSRPSAEVP
jgi:hypothetical protein